MLSVIYILWSEKLLWSLVKNLWSMRRFIGFSFCMPTWGLYWLNLVSVARFTRPPVHLSDFGYIHYWPNGSHGPAHFQRARSARHLQYMNGRHTRDKRVRSAIIPLVWHACVTCCRSSIPRTSHADVVHMMRALYARHSRCKTRRKRASLALHPPWEVRFLAWCLLVSTLWDYSYFSKQSQYYHGSAYIIINHSTARCRDVCPCQGYLG
jgi:hypothetical protein